MADRRGPPFHTYFYHGSDKHDQTNTLDLNIKSTLPDHAEAFSTHNGPRVIIGDGPTLITNGPGDAGWLPVWSGPQAPTQGPSPGNPNAGILTTGQFNCICVIVAIFDDPTDAHWSQAWITHVSTWTDNKAWDIIEKVTNLNYQKAYVAIAGQTAQLQNMKSLRDRFELGGPLPAGTPVRGQPPAPRAPSPRPLQVWIYMADALPGGHFGFGIDRTGRIGQIDGYIKKPPGI